MSKFRLPTIIAIIVLILGVGVGVWLVQSQQLFRIGASPEFAPQDVRITNITDNSFSVSWITDKPTTGSVKWGESAEATDTTAAPQNTELVNVHYVRVVGVSPTTTYYFRINSGDGEFDNNGIPWQTQTGPALAAPSGTGIISGSVVTAAGQPAKDVVVYINGVGIQALSSVTTASGTWVITTSIARTSDLGSYATISGEAPLLEIFAQGGVAGVATAQIYPKSANPVPPIILGQTHDFRDAPVNAAGELPSATIELPHEATSASGFAVGGGTATPSATTVTLTSVDPGEVVTTTTPEFFGDGPPGTTITITVQSDPITDTVKVDSAGNWDWSPPAGLEPGTHTITLKWTDAGGILRTLTRTFTVQASEGPAFESTPSATPTASPSASPSATPRVSLPSTEAGVPDSGTLTPTLLLSMMGLGLLGLGFVIWKHN